MKKLISIFLFCFLSISIFSKEYYFSNPNKDIPEEAKGQYSFNSENMFFFYTCNNEKINLYDKIIQQLPHQSKIFFPYSQYYYSGLSELDFVQFDKLGNQYIILSKHNPSEQKASLFISKYDPIENAVTIYNPDISAIPKSLAVSDDGSWIFFSCTRDYSTNNGDGKPCVYAIPTIKPSAMELIYESKLDFQTGNFIYNLCFEPNTKYLYFSNLGWVEKYRTHIDKGLFVLKPDSNMNYSKKGLQQYSNVDVFSYRDFYQRIKDQNLDANILIDDLKRCSGQNLNYDNIELSLKYFKSQKNTKYSDLYKEDSFGNPLTDQKALEYLFETQFYLFADFASNIYSWPFDRNGYNNGFPYELLLVYKDTGFPSYNLDKEYLCNRASEEAGYVFCNNDGVWLNAKREDGSEYSELYKIADLNGNFLPNDETLSSIHLKSIYIQEKDLIYDDEYILFLPKTNDKIYSIHENTLTDCSTLIQKQSPFTKEDLIIVKNFLKEDNTNEEIPAKNKSLYISPILFLTIFGIFLILILIIILNPKMNKLLKDCIHLSNIKKDKKNIFDIQEKERGKISRDIHDSIIQDIRAIRLNTEMLKVDAESESRKQQIISTATQCVVNLRNICYNLTPAELATHVDGDNAKIELISIIQTLVTQFIEKTHVPCSIQIEKNFSYPVFEKEISQNLFRIIQEALNNIEKHSYATQCSIYIKEKSVEDKNFMVIYISDDGIGCDIKKLLARKKKMHFGLQNIIDRAELIGAEIEFRSEQGDGMEIIVSVPIK